MLSLILWSGALSALAPQSSSGLAPLGTKPERTLLDSSHQPGVLEIKFQHGSGVRLRDGRFHGAAPELALINAYLAELGAAAERLFLQSEEWLEQWRRDGEALSGLALHDLNLFYRIRLPRDESSAAACDRLNAYGVVELAYPVGRVTDPMVVGAAPRVGPPLAPAPDFRSRQDYREAAPLGVDADFGNTFSGGRGEGHVIADVETGWTDDHEDITHKALGRFIGLMPPPYPWDHGTAVLGELVGQDNKSGVLGIVHQSEILMSSHLGFSTNIPTAVANAAAAIGAGDVLVLEVQCFGTPPSPFPCEYEPAIFATVQTATANGIHVFAAAGNGDSNLDSAAYGGAFNRSIRDSGAVMCGASDGASLNKAYFSNYGTRLDAHGWGFNVTTCGYGDLYSSGFPPEPHEYTAVFSGTSSATPIVTGAGMILNGVHRECFGSDLSPLALRSLLTATGTPQGSGGQIGPRPNVRAALASLKIPTLSVSGNLVVGGSVTVSFTGVTGDSYIIGFSPTLAPVPAYLPPYGYLYLNLPAQKQVSGVVPAGGVASVTQPIPNDPTLSGRTIGYVQGWQSFTASPGTGTFSNYVPVTIL